MGSVPREMFGRIGTPGETCRSLSRLGPRFHLAFACLLLSSGCLRPTACSARLQPTDCAGHAREVRILTKWLYLPRLETRTKESNIRASTLVANQCAQ